MPASLDLGRLILLSNPYEAEVPPVPAPEAKKDSPQMSPMMKEGATGVDTLFTLCLDGVEVQDYSGKWEFRGSERYVAATMRIPYMYFKKTKNGGKVKVVDYLLVGFEGGGSH